MALPLANVSGGSPRSSTRDGSPQPPPPSQTQIHAQTHTHTHTHVQEDAEAQAEQWGAQGLSAMADPFTPSPTRARPKKDKKDRSGARKRRRNKPGATENKAATPLDDAPHSPRTKPDHDYAGGNSSVYSGVFDISSHRSLASELHGHTPVNGVPHVLWPAYEPVHSSSPEWLGILMDWMNSKSLVSFEYMEELEERKKWQEWAVCAAEGERTRRIGLLQEMEEAERLERMARREWALNAIEEERRHRISQQFLSALTSTQWFNETISSFSENYELVCPYFRLGCKVTCNRKDLERHLKTCPYSNDPVETLYAMQSHAYEVMCPNAVMGCTHSCPLSEIGLHLELCPFGGPTQKDEALERDNLKSIVISECEEERARRLADDEPPEGDDADASASVKLKHSLLQILVDQQIHGALGELHHEILGCYRAYQQKQDQVRIKQLAAIEQVRHAVSSFWPFAVVECFGSTMSGFMSPDSDVDLVVCFSDEHQTLPLTCGVLPLLQLLAVFLSEQHSQWLKIKKFNVHARVPVIKAEVFQDSTVISLDITIDGPTHTGLATTEFVRCVAKHLPPIVPLVYVLRHFLKAHSLDNAYTGGIPSYGLVLLSLLVLLQRVRGTDIPNVSRSTSPVSRAAAPDKKRRSFTKGFQGNDTEAQQFTWGSVTQQRNFGRAVARKMLSLPDITIGEDDDLVLLPVESPVLGELLMEFLTLYGEDFDPGKHGFSVRNGGFRFSVQGPPPHPQATDPLIIEDPVNVINNVGKNSYKVSQLQKLLSEAHGRLMSAIVRFNGRQVSGHESESLLEHVFHLNLSQNWFHRQPLPLTAENLLAAFSSMSEPNSPPLYSFLTIQRARSVDGLESQFVRNFDDSAPPSVTRTHRYSLSFNQSPDLGQHRPRVPHARLFRMTPRLAALERSICTPAPDVPANRPAHEP